MKRLTKMSMSTKFAIQRFPSTQFLDDEITSFIASIYTGVVMKAMQQAIDVNEHDPDRITQHILTKATGQKSNVFQVKTVGFHNLSFG